MEEKRKLRKNKNKIIMVGDTTEKTRIRKVHVEEDTDIQLLNASFADAQTIEEGTNILGILNDYSEYDYYDIFFGNHTVGLVTVEPQGNYALDVQIYDEYENRLGSAYGEPGQFVKVRIPLKRGRNFYVRVTLGANILDGTKASYILRCEKMDDIKEETTRSNDYIDEAQYINVYDTVLGWIDEEEDYYDVYEIIPTESGTMRITLQPSDEHMKMEMYVYDEDEDVIDSDRGLKGRQAELEISVRAGRRYYIETSLYSAYESNLEYVLHTEMVGVGGGISWPYKNFMTYDYTSNNREDFKIIVTPARNIKSERINCNISDTSYFGINGGFYHADNGYDNPPTGGASIHWNKNGSDNFNKNYKGSSGNEVLRNAGTLVTYNDGGTVKALITQVERVEQIKEKFGNIDILTAIGGGSLHLRLSEGEWEERVYGAGGEFEGGKAEITPLYDTRRTGLGFKNINGEWYIYMVVSTEISGASMYDLRNVFLELDCYDAIFLDGSGSSQFRIKEMNGSINVDSGTSPTLRTGRKIWNMVRLIDSN